MTRKITATEVSPDYPVEFTSIYKDSQGTLWLGTTETDCTDTTKTIINSYPWSSLHKTERICVIFAASKKICVEIYGSEPKTDFSSMTIQITATYNIGSMQRCQSGLTDNAIYTIYKAGVTLCGSALSSEGQLHQPDRK